MSSFSTPQPPQKVKALIFDIGNVIFDISFDLVFLHAQKLTGRDAQELKSLFTFNEVFESFERGHVTPEEFTREFNRQTRLNLSLEQFDACWNAIYLDAFPGIGDLLQTLKTTYRVVALSNTNILHTNDWLLRYAPIVGLFERLFLSNEMGERKPDARAYQMVLEYLEMQPHEVLFLDDKIENIHGAAALGIHTIHVLDYKQMRDDLSLQLVV